MIMRRRLGKVGEEIQEKAQKRAVSRAFTTYVHVCKETLSLNCPGSQTLHNEALRQIVQYHHWNRR